MSYVKAQMAQRLLVLRTPTLIFLIFQIKIIFSQLTHTNCSITQDKYTPNSIFHQNLQIVLRNMTSASTTKYSFYNFSSGLENNAVYGLYLCRGDINPEDCNSCISNATQSITKECPNQKESIKWVPECMLRYANRNIFSKEEESPSYNWRISPTRPQNKTAISPTKIIFDIPKAVHDLINETAFSDYSFLNATSYFKYKKYNITAGRDPETIYFLAQCTPDISPLMCQKCLTQAYTGMRGSAQSLAYLPSCNLRYDLRKFYHSKDDTLIKSPSRSPQSSEGEKKKPKGSTRPANTIIILSILTLLLLFGLCILIWRRNTSGETENTDFLKYDIKTIKAAVNNFSEDNVLGKGGFGKVYKGTLRNGDEIAVKRLTNKDSSEQKQRSVTRHRKQKFQVFKAEVLVVANLQHKNLVRLLGYCDTKTEKLLIFEYLPFSSLDKLLFDGGNSPLAWESRYKIIDGIAKGLLYLHEESRYKIVHRDLKPENILLDSDMTAKISDFGLAKTFGEDEVQNITEAQHIRAKPCGTEGYIAPELFKGKSLSVKSDVFSFGILVLEIVSGQKIRGGSRFLSEDEEGLLLCARRLWKSKEPLALVDPILCGDFSPDEATRCIHIGLLCAQNDPDKRPTMASIVGVLSSNSKALPELPPESSESFLKPENMPQLEYQPLILENK